jgi:hypothetical protein
VALTYQLSASMAAWDPASLDAETLSRDVLAMLKTVKDIVEQGGEQAYMCRRSALFLLENLSLALRRNIDERAVPQEHASLLDAAYDKVRSVTSGVIEGTDPNVSNLEKIEEQQKEFLKQALADAGLLAKVPTGSDKKLIV